MRRIQPETLVRNVGRRIVELRRAAGLTQAAFAEKLGCSIQYASLVERGTQNLGLTSLAQVANVLGVGVEELLRVPSAEAKVVKRGRPRTR